MPVGGGPTLGLSPDHLSDLSRFLCPFPSLPSQFVKPKFKIIMVATRRAAAARVEPPREAPLAQAQAVSAQPARSEEAPRAAGAWKHSLLGRMRGVQVKALEREIAENLPRAKALGQKADLTRSECEESHRLLAQMQERYFDKLSQLPADVKQKLADGPGGEFERALRVLEVKVLEQVMADSEEEAERAEPAGAGDKATAPVEARPDHTSDIRMVTDERAVKGGTKSASAGRKRGRGHSDSESGEDSRGSSDDRRQRRKNRSGAEKRRRLRTRRASADTDDSDASSDSSGGRRVKLGKNELAALRELDPSAAAEVDRKRAAEVLLKIQARGLGNTSRVVERAAAAARHIGGLLTALPPLHGDRATSQQTLQAYLTHTLMGHLTGLEGRVRGGRVNATALYSTLSQTLLKRRAPQAVEGARDVVVLQADLPASEATALVGLALVAGLQETGTFTAAELLEVFMDPAGINTVYARAAPLIAHMLLGHSYATMAQLATPFGGGSLLHTAPEAPAVEKTKTRSASPVVEVTRPAGSIQTYNGGMRDSEYTGLFCYGCGRTGPRQIGCPGGCVHLIKGRDAHHVPVEHFTAAALKGHRLYDPDARDASGRRRVGIAKVRTPNDRGYEGFATYLLDRALFPNDASRRVYVAAIGRVFTAELVKRVESALGVIERSLGSGHKSERRRDRSPPKEKRADGKKDKSSAKRAGGSA